MGGFTDYSIPNGDRDEEVVSPKRKNEITESPSVSPENEAKNLVVRVIASNSQVKGKTVKVKPIPIPRAFDEEYYQRRITKANENSDNRSALCAIAIKRYMNAVYDFHRQVMFAFNKKHNIYAMPEYIQLCEDNPEDIKSLMEIVISREEDLVKKFGNTDNVIKAFKESKHMAELKRYAAQAWLMYCNLNNSKKTDFLGDLIELQQFKETADLNNNMDVANLFGLHVHTAGKIDASIKHFFNPYRKGNLSKINPKACYIYEDVDGLEEFTYLVDEKNAYNHSKNSAQIYELKDKIPDGSIEKQIVDFYSNYRDVKYVIFRLDQIQEQCKTRIPDRLFFYHDSLNSDESLRHRDLFEKAVEYYEQNKTLVKNLPIKCRVYTDICRHCMALEEMKDLNKNYHKICEERIAKEEELFRKEYPHIAEQFDKEDGKTI